MLWISFVIVRKSVVEMSVSSDSPGESHVFLLDRNSVGMDAAQVSIFKDTNEVSFGGLLEGKKGLSLESEVVIDISYYFSHKSLEWSSWKKEACALLISFDLSESNSSWLISDLSILFLGL